MQPMTIQRFVTAAAQAWRRASIKFLAGWIEDNHCFAGPPRDGNPVDTAAWHNAAFQVLLAEYHYPRDRVPERVTAFFSSSPD